MTKRITISTLDAMKASGDKFVMITAYDATFARLASEAGAETILVGDSLGMGSRAMRRRSLSRWTQWLTTPSVLPAHDPIL